MPIKSRREQRLEEIRRRREEEEAKVKPSAIARMAQMRLLTPDSLFVLVERELPRTYVPKLHPHIRIESFQLGCVDKDDPTVAHNVSATKVMMAKVGVFAHVPMELYYWYGNLRDDPKVWADAHASLVDWCLTAVPIIVTFFSQYTTKYPWTLYAIGRFLVTQELITKKRKDDDDDEDKDEEPDVGGWKLKFRTGLQNETANLRELLDIMNAFAPEGHKLHGDEPTQIEDLLFVFSVYKFMYRLIKDPNVKNLGTAFGLFDRAFRENNLKKWPANGVPGVYRPFDFFEMERLLNRVVHKIGLGVWYERSATTGRPTKPVFNVCFDIRKYLCTEYRVRKLEKRSDGAFTPFMSPVAEDQSAVDTIQLFALAAVFVKQTTFQGLLGRCAFCNLGMAAASAVPCTRCKLVTYCCQECKDAHSTQHQELCDMSIADETENELMAWAHARHTI